MRTPRPGQDFKFKFNLGVRCTVAPGPSLDIGARCVFLMQKGRVSRNAKRHWQSIPGRVPHFQALEQLESWASEEVQAMEALELIPKAKGTA